MGLRTANLAALVLGTAFLVVAGAEAVQRAIGLPPSVPPGWTPAEFAGRLAGIDMGRDCLVVGDSRVGWGVADRLVTQALPAAGMPEARAWNLGLPGTGAAAILAVLEPRLAAPSRGAILLHYSPGALFFFRNPVELPPAGTAGHGPSPLAGDIPKRVETAIGGWFQASTATLRDTAARAWADLRKGRLPSRPGGDAPVFVARTVFDDGFVNGRMARPSGAPFDPAEDQLGYYRSMYGGAPALPGDVLAGLRERLDAFRRAGWGVAMVRLPVGPRMAAMEAALPARLQPEAVAAALGVPFTDLAADPRTRDLPTQDESHLTPDAARAIAPVLAQACAAARRAGS